MGHWDRRAGGGEPEWGNWASKNRSRLPARAFAYAKGEARKLPHHWLDRKDVLWVHPKGVAAAHRMVSRTDISEAAKAVATKHLDRHLRILEGDSLGTLTMCQKSVAREVGMRYLFSGKKEIELEPEVPASDEMRRRLAVDSIEVSLDWKDVEEVDGVAWFRGVVLSKEMVQDYGDLKVLKCTDELSAAVPFMDFRPVTDGHPAEQIVTKRDQICGRLENSKMLDCNLVADLAITCDPLKEAIKSDARREVSIGFHADWDPTPGKLGDEEYDAVQRNILIDHVAVVEKGRCSLSDGCGITMEVLEVAADGTVSGVLTAEQPIVSSDAVNLKWIAEYVVDRLMQRYVEGRVLEGALAPLFAVANEAVTMAVQEAVTGFEATAKDALKAPHATTDAKLEVLQSDAKTANEAVTTQLDALKETLENLVEIVGPGLAVDEGGKERKEGREKVNRAYRDAFSGPDVSI